MKTQIFNMQTLDSAAKLLQEGKLVAFPTETVFGLGAIANNDEAIQNVYHVKRRPSDNPLIIHVSSSESVQKYAVEVDELSQKLMDAFWPGPLTIILPIKEGIISKNAVNGKSTAGFRMPRQLETLLLIEMVGFPLVGPSANLSGKPSPTQVEHVLHDFDGKISGIVSNNSHLTEVGVESTVVYPQEDKVIILRPGQITAGMIEEVVKVPTFEKTAQDQLNDSEIMSPGVKYTHYSPSQPVYLIKYDNNINDWKQILAQFSGKIGLLADDEKIELLKNDVAYYYSLGEKDNISSATQKLFDGLRTLEQTNAEIIVAQGLENIPQANAYMNRLSKASNFVL